MSESPTDPKAPAVLRQEGPHRVKVAPGAHSALSTSVGLGTKRLRPAVGSVEGVAASADLGLEGGAALQRRVPGMRSVTDVQRLPGRKPVQSRFAPGLDEPRAAPTPADTLGQRLSHLAELNASTARTVAAVERDLADPVASAEPSSVAPEHGLEAAEPPKARRSLFKRR